MIQFSIITPSYHQGQTIARTIESVRSQSYPHWEHLIVDGGSTDATLEVLKRYPHLRWVSEPDRGKPAAINRGFRMATGNVLAWISGDDAYATEALQKAAQQFERNPELQVLMGRAAVTDPQGKFLYVQEEPQAEGYTHEGILSFWKHPMLPQPSLFFRREVLDVCGFLNEDLWSYMDYDFLLMISRRFKIVRNPEILSFIGFHDAAGSVLDIKAGLLRSTLYRISRRYWGKPTQRVFWKHFFSYAAHWPALAWRYSYEQFALTYKNELKTQRRAHSLAGFLWAAKKIILRHPIAFLTAGFRRGMHDLTR